MKIPGTQKTEIMKIIYNTLNEKKKKLERRLEKELQEVLK